MTSKFIRRESSDTLLLQGLSDIMVVVSGIPKRIIYSDCTNIKIIPEANERDFIHVRGGGNQLQWPLIVGTKSRDVVFGKVLMESMVDETSKESWKATVPNGFEVRPDCQGVYCESITGSALHYPILARGSDITIDGGDIKFISGDFIRSNGNNNWFRNIKGEYSLEVWEYAELHRDHFHAYQEDGITTHQGKPAIKSGGMENCKFWTPDIGHKWAKSCDAWVLSDGSFVDMRFSGNRSYMNNDNGLRAGPMPGCKVTGDNVIARTDGDKSRTPKINIGGSLQKGTVDIKSIGLEVASIVPDITIDGAKQSSVVSYSLMFDNWMQRIRNTAAEAITDEDFIAAAKLTGIDVLWIRAVFRVESREQSFNSDGSIVTLFERHVLRKQVLAHGFSKEIVSAIKKRLGGNLFSMRPGGYKGGLAEWQRIKEAACGIAEVIFDFDIALNLALSAASFGGPQILGKWSNVILGYANPVAMVEAVHANEAAHLSGFIAFIQKNGLDKHLRAAATDKDPYSAIVRFAKGYNGKFCCDRGGKRKNYAAEILREQRALADEPEKFESLVNSRNQQGNVTSIVGKVISIGGLTETAGITNFTDIGLTKLADKAQAMKEQAAAAIKDAEAVRGQVTELLQKSTELNEQISNYEGWLGMLILVLGLSLIGNFYSLYARWDDRRRGYK